MPDGFNDLQNIDMENSEHDKVYEQIKKFAIYIGIGAFGIIAYIFFYNAVTINPLITSVRFPLSEQSRTYFSSFRAEYTFPIKYRNENFIVTGYLERSKLSTSEEDFVQNGFVRFNSVKNLYGNRVVDLSSINFHFDSNSQISNYMDPITYDVSLPLYTNMTIFVDFQKPFPPSYYSFFLEIHHKIPRRELVVGHKYIVVIIWIIFSIYSLYFQRKNHISSSYIFHFLLMFSLFSIHPFSLLPENILVDFEDIYISSIISLGLIKCLMVFNQISAQKTNFTLPTFAYIIYWVILFLSIYLSLNNNFWNMLKYCFCLIIMIPILFSIWFHSLIDLPNIFLFSFVSLLFMISAVLFGTEIQEICCFVAIILISLSEFNTILINIESGKEVIYTIEVTQSSSSSSAPDDNHLILDSDDHYNN